MGAARSLIQALSVKSGFEPVDLNEKENMIRILGRVRPETAAQKNWSLITHALINAADIEGCPWSIDVSKKYLSRGGELRFAWRLIIQGQAIDTRIPELIQIVQRAPLASVHEVTEIPMPGVSSNRNSLSRGKGVGPVGTVPTGPMALNFASK